jgi:predicted thioesterase
MAPASPGDKIQVELAAVDFARRSISFRLPALV